MNVGNPPTSTWLAVAVVSAIFSCTEVAHADIILAIGGNGPVVSYGLNTGILHGTYAGLADTVGLTIAGPSGASYTTGGANIDTRGLEFGLTGSRPVGVSLQDLTWHANRLYGSDSFNNAVVIVDPGTGATAAVPNLLLGSFRITFGGGLTDPSTGLAFIDLPFVPSGLAYDGTNFYVSALSDTMNFVGGPIAGTVIRKFSPDGIGGYTFTDLGLPVGWATTFLDDGAGGALVDYSGRNPGGLSLDGSMLLIGTDSGEVWTYDTTGVLGFGVTAALTVPDGRFVATLDSMVVPEPASAVLLGSVLITLLAAYRKAA